MAAEPTIPFPNENFLSTYEAYIEHGDCCRLLRCHVPATRPPRHGLMLLASHNFAAQCCGTQKSLPCSVAARIAAKKAAVLPCACASCQCVQWSFCAFFMSFYFSFYSLCFCLRRWSVSILWFSFTCPTCPKLRSGSVVGSKG